MTGILRKLRDTIDAQYEREIGWLQDRYPFTAGYDLQPPVNRWHAIHLTTGTVVGPARNITGLLSLILADHQARPPHPPALPGGGDPRLAALEYCFGPAYHLIPVAGGYIAMREGAALHAATADGLRDSILADLGVLDDGTLTGSMR